MPSLDIKVLMDASTNCFQENENASVAFLCWFLTNMIKTISRLIITDEIRGHDLITVGIQIVMDKGDTLPEKRKNNHKGTLSMEKAIVCRGSMKSHIWELMVKREKEQSTGK
ncbi:MAG: hypothetical protein JSW28_05860 [Thermoplasmata archaeon]|nr:MAG: hypothetical protein JSW28_05860 [Thermoplasmata archaeon]